jgi:riboflavin biosynthesis pyrimidine reductase
LYDRPERASFHIPAELAESYGGDLAMATPRLYANFVASVDGVVALRSGVNSGSIISGRSEADRFVMGLLRACAEAVLLAAGTFRMTPGHLWHAEHVYPKAAPLFAEMRSALGLSPRPLLVLISASGDLDTAHPALRHETLIVTTPAGASKLRGANVRLSVVEENPISAASIAGILRKEGLRRVLTEGGPSLFGQLLAAGLIDELFLTTSPLLLGRSAGDGRRALVEGADLFGSNALELLSLRRHESHLFLRYAVKAA